MSESKFTPGSWDWEFSRDGKYCDARVYADNSVEEHSPDCELLKAQKAVAKAKGESA